MNKEIHRKSVPVDPTEKKPSRCSLGIKAFLYLAILVIMAAETLKSTLLAAETESKANIVFLALFLAGGVILLILFFAFSICITNDSPKILRAFKELLVVGAFVLPIYATVDTFIKTSDGEPNSLENLIDLNGSIAILLVSCFATETFELSAAARFLIIAFYFLMPGIKTFLHSDFPRTGKTYTNVLVPLIYLTIFLILNHIYEGQKQRILANKKSSKLSNIIEQMQDSVILYDRKGNIDILNGFLKKHAQEKRLPAADVLLKIREVSMVKEEKLVSRKHKIDVLNDSQDNLTSQDESYIVDMPESIRKVEDIEPVMINLDEITSARPMLANNLENILKTLLFNITSHEITEPKTIKYRAKFEADKKKFYYLEIKARVNPQSSTPITIITRDVTAQQILDEQSACDKTRQALVANLAGEINNVVGSTKIILEEALAEMRVKNTAEDIGRILVNITQQMLSPIMATIGDITDFCHSKKTKLKYNYAPCDLKKVLEKIVVLFSAQAKQQNSKIVVDFKQDLLGSAVANTDQKRLIQLMVRLVSNAIKNTTNGTIKISINAYNGSFSVHVEDTGKGIKESNLEKITEELKIYQPDDLKLIHSKAKKHQGLPIAQMLALGLGPKSISGLTIKSQYGIGTTVWFIIENKQNTEEDGKSESQLMSPQMIQKRGFSPMKPSRFKMTFDYDAQDGSSIIEFNESVGVNNPVNQNLEAQIGRRSGELSPRRSGELSPKRSLSLFSADATATPTNNRKSRFAEKEEQLRLENEKADGTGSSTGADA